jgi:hypothetical protein
MDIQEFIEGAIGELVRRIYHSEKKAEAVFNDFTLSTATSVIERRFGPIRGNDEACTKILGNNDVRNKLK